METGFEPREVQLRDGRTVRLREARPTDEDEFLQAFGRMSSQARYMRFMSAIRNPNVARLHAVLESIPEHGEVIVATVRAPDGIDIVGSAMFMLLPDGASCEFAITVNEQWNGAGLGRVLMEAIIEAARARGLATIQGFVFSSNQPMLRLAERVGFSAARDPDDATIRVVTLHLR